jgi:hypothetical protein
MSSNNIYNILGKLNALTPQQETPKETAQRIYESVEAKGSVLEGVKAVEAKLTEKYMGFKAVEKAAKKGGAENPAAVAASIGRKKYGKAAFQKAAASGKKMGESDEQFDEERETLKTKKGTIYKGGTYGTEYDGSGEGEKKAKPKAKDGEKKTRGRPKKEKPASFDAPKGDIFGRTTGTAPKGKKGTVIKGKANQDTVDETREANPTIPGTVNKAQSRYTPANSTANKNAQVKKLSKPTNKYDNVKNESRAMFGKALMENVNFKKMMDDADMTADEMLEAINSDIQAYKSTGDMTNRLRDFMHLHNHMKKVEMEAAPQGSSFAPQMPSGQDILPKQSTLGKIGSTVKKAFTGPNDDELLARLQQDSQPTTTVDEELNELAKLAGITDEGNEFSGERASAIEQHRDHFEVDGKTYPVKEGTNLEDIARLSGIFKEGKDYGDTTYNEPPTYDNSPDECVQGADVMLKGGDGEVAGMEKKMHNDKPTFKNGDNPLSETAAMLKPAAEFNYVKDMGRDLLKAYQDIKTK